MFTIQRCCPVIAAFSAPTHLFSLQFCLMLPSGHNMGCCNSHTEAILQNGRGMYDIPLSCCRQFPAKTMPGTFKVALDSAVSRIACAGSDHAIRIIDWYSGQVITDGFGHGEPATSLCFTHDIGQLVSVSGAKIFEYEYTSTRVRTQLVRTTLCVCAVGSYPRALYRCI
jgi:hypothetical protein